MSYYYTALTPFSNSVFTTTGSMVASRSIRGTIGSITSVQIFSTKDIITHVFVKVFQKKTQKIINVTPSPQCHPTLPSALVAKLLVKSRSCLFTRNSNGGLTRIEHTPAHPWQLLKSCNEFSNKTVSCKEHTFIAAYIFWVPWSHYFPPVDWMTWFVIKHSLCNR